MKKVLPKYPRILGIAPSTRGFGFALVERLHTLADWGVKSVTGDKNTGCIAQVEKMITHYRPDVLVLENTSIRPFRRSVRIRDLCKRIIRLAESRGVTVVLFSRDQVRQTFFADGQGTKHALAEILAKKFPDELGFRLPPKRRPWMSEDYRMSIFDAVALALMVRQRHHQKRSIDLSTTFLAKLLTRKVQEGRNAFNTSGSAISPLCFLTRCGWQTRL